jgi:hypothetical protein
VRSVIGFVTHNWKLKLAAFALAMLLWVTVTADQIAIRWLMVPVIIEVQDASLHLVQGPAPSEVQVRISGPRREFWDLGLNRPEIRMVLSNIQEGTHTFSIDPQQVLIPRRVARGLTPIDVRPSRITVSLQRVASAEVPVRLQLGEALPPEFALAGALVLRPEVIRISGPSAQVAAVSEVSTEPLDMSQLRGEFGVSVALDTAGLGGLELSARQVVVVGRVEQAAELVIPNVAVEAPPGVLVVPGSVNVRVWGAESVVRGITAAALRVVVPPEVVPTEIATGGVAAPIRVQEVPGGLRAVPEPAIVRILAVPQPGALPEVRPFPGAVTPPPSPPDTVPDGPDSDAPLR